MKMIATINSCTCPMNPKGTAFAINFNCGNINGLEEGNSVISPTFTTGGHEFYIECYRRGYKNMDNGVYTALYFKPQQKQENDVSVIFDMYLLNKDGKPSWDTLKRVSRLFHSLGENQGFHQLISKLESAHMKEYINTQGCFVIICVIKFEGKSCSQVPKKRRFIETSQFDVDEDFSNILGKGVISDVIFQVEEKSFAAQKMVLAVRSPVFKAELFSFISESESQLMRPIVIKDMQPIVCKAMLYFMYTDTVPELDDVKDLILLAQHLIVAADRYAIDKLKLYSEEMLCNRISLDRVVSMLVLMLRHNYTCLKDACIEFIGDLENRRKICYEKEFIELVVSVPSLLDETGAKNEQY